MRTNSRTRYIQIRSINNKKLNAMDIAHFEIHNEKDFSKGTNCDNKCEPCKSNDYAADLNETHRLIKVCNNHLNDFACRIENINKEVERKRIDCKESLTKEIDKFKREYEVAKNSLDVILDVLKANNGMTSICVHSQTQKVAQEIGIKSKCLKLIELAKTIASKSKSAVPIKMPSEYFCDNNVNYELVALIKKFDEINTSLDDCTNAVNNGANDFHKESEDLKNSIENVNFNKLYKLLEQYNRIKVLQNILNKEAYKSPWRNCQIFLLTGIVLFLLSLLPCEGDTYNIYHYILLSVGVLLIIVSLIRWHYESKRIAEFEKKKNEEILRIISRLTY